MKLSNLVLIFIIIIIPIILVFSYYLSLGANTIRIQIDYDEKLIEATKEAVEAFEINTVEWKQGSYNTLQNLKREHLNASTETFLLSLGNKLGISGISKEYMLNYIPAIVYIMYDGYYIYSPTYVPQVLTNEEGNQLYYYEEENYFGPEAKIDTTLGELLYIAEDEEKEYTTNRDEAKKEYKHVLKTYVPYSDIYDNKYVINYSLDNYVRVYGNSKEESNEGYILDLSKISVQEGSRVEYNNEMIYPELLTEKIPVRNSVLEDVEIKEYPYIYVTSTDKRYYDIYEGENNGKFFELTSDYVKNYDIDEYKKILVVSENDSSRYIELYQRLNGGNGEWYYKNLQGEYTVADIPGINMQNYEIDKYLDCSAINYYIENYCFNKWLDKKGITIDITNKNEKIIENINNNLNLAISNYSYNSTLNYKIPELSPGDWEQALSNISMITFFQGAKIGLKTYNNYTVVTSTENNEYISENSLLYIAKDNESNVDNYFHRYGCTHQIDSTYNPKEAYRNTEFKVKKCDFAIYGEQTDPNGVTKVVKTGEDSVYLYKHEANMQCFDCIVNQNNFGFKDNTYEYDKVCYNSLARERYIQMSRISMLRQEEIDIDLENELPNGNVIPECSHASTIMVSIGDAGHHKKCTICNKVLSGTENHNFSKGTPIIDNDLLKTSIQHRKKCNECGYEKEEDHVPKINNGEIMYYFIDNKGHWKICEDCDSEFDKEDHVYERGQDRCKCGKTKNS